MGAAKHPPATLLLEVMERPIQVRRPDTAERAVLRKDDGPYEAYVEAARIIVPSEKHCGLTVNELRDAWDELLLEIRLRGPNGWSQVTEWDELSLVLNH